MQKGEILPFENRIVAFTTHDGQIYAGVIADSFSIRGAIKGPLYEFIQMSCLLPWKDAEKKKDTVTMRRLESKVDIRNIKGISFITWRWYRQNEHLIKLSQRK